MIANSDLAEKYANRILINCLDSSVAVKCPCWLYHFAKDVVGGKLPKEMHNMMRLFGVKDPSDPWVMKYFGTKKLQKVRKARNVVVPANQLGACGANIALGFSPSTTEARK